MVTQRILMLIGGLVLSLALLTETAIVTGQGEPSTAVNVDEVKEDVVRDLFDENGKMMNTDQRLAKAAAEHAGGFGGYYFHDTDKSIVYVYMQDTSESQAAKNAFRAAGRSKYQVTQIIPVQGDYAFNDLVNWFHALDRAMVAADIHPTTGGVFEVDNRIRFGLEDMSQAADAREIMGTLEIPAGQSSSRRPNLSCWTGTACGPNGVPWWAGPNTTSGWGTSTAPWFRDGAEQRGGSRSGFPLHQQRRGYRRC